MIENFILINVGNDIFCNYGNFERKIIDINFKMFKEDFFKIFFREYIGFYKGYINLEYIGKIIFFF